MIATMRISKGGQPHPSSSMQSMSIVSFLLMQHSASLLSSLLISSCELLKLEVDVIPDLRHVECFEIECEDARESRAGLKGRSDASEASSTPSRTPPSRRHHPTPPWAPHTAPWSRPILPWAVRRQPTPAEALRHRPTLPWEPQRLSSLPWDPQPQPTPP